MDHSEAIRTKASERYLLNELSAAEREAYEDHYFSCPQCAEDVNAGAVLIANARELLRHERASVPSKRPVKSASAAWFAWVRPAWGVAATALVLILLLYQSFVTIPQLRRQAAGSMPQALPSFSFITLGSRGGSELTVAVRPGEAFGMYVDIPASIQFTSYTCEVQTTQGTPKFSVSVSGQQARDTVQILVPGSTLAAGQYQLVIRGNREASKSALGDEIARYRFVVSNVQ